MIVLKDFDPDKHPRDERGRFSDGLSESGKEGFLQTGMAGMNEVSREYVDKKMKDAGVKYENLLQEIENTAKDNLKDGEKWYPDAHDASKEIAKKYGFELDQTIAVIAALSPQTEWNRNLKEAEDVLKFVKENPDKSLNQTILECHNLPYAKIATLERLTKAVEIAKGSDIDKTLSGPKVRAFFNSIYEPNQTNDVTIDGHMLKAFGRAANLSKEEVFKLYTSSSNKKLGREVPNVAIAAMHAVINNVAKDLKTSTGAVQAAYWLKMVKDYTRKWPTNATKN